MTAAVRVAILTVSDRVSRGERADVGGEALEAFVSSRGWEVVRRECVPDDQELVEATLMRWSDEGLADVILTTGGTGFAPRDRTPEATLAVVERLAPGLPEAMRAAHRGNPHALLSRAVAGIRCASLILNLPGNPTGAVESLEVVADALPHAVELLRGEAGEASHSFPGKSQPSGS